MTTQTPAAYQPTSDDDARIHLSQIVGSDSDISVWTGDWHDALNAYNNRHPLPTTPATETAA